jgi:dephospho-CoA kinase
LDWVRQGDTIKVLGVTGRTASGKSTVSGYIKKIRKGTLVVDVDKLAKSIYRRKPEILYKLAELFGKEIFDAKGNLVFKRLGEKVFSSKKELTRLNNLMFPLIKSEVKKILSKNNKMRYIVIDAAIMFDCGLDEFCDYIILVNNSFERRKIFLKENGYSDEEIKLKIEGQYIKINESRLDFVIDNNGTKKSLMDEVRKRLKRI